MGNRGSRPKHPPGWAADLCESGGDTSETAIGGSVTSRPEVFVITSSLVENDPRYGDRWNQGYQNFYVARLGASGGAAAAATPFLFAQRHNYVVELVDATSGRPIGGLRTSANVQVNAARGRKGKYVKDPWEKASVFALRPRFDGQAGVSCDGRDVFEHFAIDHRTGAIASIPDARHAYDLQLPRRPNPRSTEWKSTSELDMSSQTSKFSISVKSKSFWLIFGRLFPEVR